MKRYAQSTTTPGAFIVRHRQLSPSFYAVCVAGDCSWTDSGAAITSVGLRCRVKAHVVETGHTVAVDHVIQHMYERIGRG